MRHPAHLFVAHAVLVLSLATASATAKDMSYLQEGKLKVGVDLDRGGAITYLSHAEDGRNLINNHDCGRQVQQSYYSGPRPFDPENNQAPAWEGFPWNPIQVGDAYGNRSTILEHRNDGKTIYVKTRPLHWSLRKVFGHCTFESWVRIEEGAVQVRHRLNNNRPDQAQYDAHTQELPAVYTVGTLYRLCTYNGAEPFTGDGLTTLENDGPPWTSWKATENWAALVDENGWGLGVFNPGAVAFSGGFHGEPGVGTSTDNSTGYIAPNHRDILDHNITYEYGYALIVGDLQEIRQWVYDHRPDPRPDYVFTTDRQHWHYRSASDNGWPIQGALHFRPDGKDPQMMGPTEAFRADRVSNLYIRAAYHVDGPESKRIPAQLYWKVYRRDDGAKPAGFSSKRSAGFRAVNDGQFHTYTIDLSQKPQWKGLIAGLRFDPVPGQTSGYVDVQAITWHKSSLPAAE